MISLEQWRAAIGEWYSRRYGRRPKICRTVPNIFAGGRVCVYFQLNKIFFGLLFVITVLCLAIAVYTRLHRLWIETNLFTTTSLQSVSCRSVHVRLNSKLLPSVPAVPMLRLLVALSWLLVVAGDVEQNPGPLTSKDKPTLDDLIGHISSDKLDDPCIESHLNKIAMHITEWKSVAPFLGLCEVDESCIVNKYKDDVKMQNIAMLRKWKETFGHCATYRALVKTLWECEKVSLVEKVCSLLGVKENGEESEEEYFDAFEEQPTVESVIQTPTGGDSTKSHPDPREAHYLCKSFASAFRHIAKLVNNSVDIEDLKDYLHGYSHHLYSEHNCVDPKIFREAKTPREVLRSLSPQCINYMNYYLLEDIVEEFECLEAKEILEKYKGTLKCSKRKLNDLPNPITDPEIEQSWGVKKAKVTVEGNLKQATMKVIDDTQEALQRSTGIDKANIVFASRDPGSIILNFLIPESISHIVYELSDEDLAILADAGILKLEMENLLLANIKQYATKKVTISKAFGTSTKLGGLEYYLQERHEEVEPQFDQYSHLHKMLVCISDEKLNELCTETFLDMFARDIRNWKTLAPFFGINELTVQAIEHTYLVESEQKRVALNLWMKHEGRTATYHNLLETLLLHGQMEDIEALLYQMGPEPAVIYANKLLRQAYIGYNSRKEWSDEPRFMDFNQKIGKITKNTTDQLANLDYSICMESLDQFPEEVTQVSLKSVVNFIGSRSSALVLIKGMHGLGKSLLIGKVCQYWARGFGLRKFKLVFWVNIATIQHPPGTLHTLLKCLFQDTFDTERISRWIKSRDGENILFILDGWDRKQETARTRNNMFAKLLSRKFLTKSTVVVACAFTPSQLYIQREKPNLAYTQFDIFGLTQEQVCKQVTQYYASDPRKAEEFLFYTVSHPDVKQLTCIPVYLYGLLCLFNFIPVSELPVTWTEVCSLLTLLLLRSIFPECKKEQFYYYTQNFPHTLPYIAKAFLFDLSKSVYKIGGAIYPQSSLASLPQLTAQKSSGFVFLHPVHNPLIHSCDLKLQLSFPLLRDFFAALHVHSLPLLEQTNKINSNKNTFLWQFYAGLTVTDLYHAHYAILAANIPENDQRMIMNCSYEARLPADFESNIDDYILGRCDIHHLLLSVPPGAQEIIFNRCILGTEALIQLSKCAGVAVQLPHTVLPSRQRQKLSMWFTECTLSAEGLFFGRMHVKELSLRMCSITDEGAKALGRTLQVNSSLKKLDLRNNKIGNRGVKCLAESLHHNTSLEELGLGSNAIGDEGATALAEALKFNHSLKKLDLQMNYIQLEKEQSLRNAFPNIAFEI